MISELDLSNSWPKLSQDSTHTRYSENFSIYDDYGQMAFNISFNEWVFSMNPLPIFWSIFSRNSNLTPSFVSPSIWIHQGKCKRNRQFTTANWCHKVNQYLRFQNWIDNKSCSGHIHLSVGSSYFHLMTLPYWKFAGVIWSLAIIIWSLLLYVWLRTG